MRSVYLQGVGVLGPGLTDWPGTAAILRGEIPYRPARTELPAPAALPSAERRRAGRVVRLALALGAEAVGMAGADPRSLPSVFSSSGGDGETCHELCVALASHERLISPTRFHNSVHNAASGYWSIGYGCPESSTALCAHDASFGAGLLEALSQLTHGAAALLLIAYDLDYPPPMHAQRPIPDGFGIALLLTGETALPSAPVASLRPSPLARLGVRFSDAAADAMSQPELERLRQAIPAARGLPLLERLAQGRSGAIVLDYLDRLGLEVELETWTA